MSSTQNDITLIAGPTASGKSARALEIAHKENAIIVNADALQVYDCYEVLTARPSQEEMEGIPHFLYGHISCTTPYSVGDWLEEVRAIIENSTRPIIIIGGTGLYFKALTEGLVDLPPIESDIRARARLLFEDGGLEALHSNLKDVDPLIMEKIDIQNPRRLMRALEVFYQTGTPLSVWQTQTPAPLIRLQNTRAFVVMPDVSTTNARIAKRFHQMMDAGAIDEVRAQLPFDASLQANKALGALEIAKMLTGKLSQDEAIEQSIIATRQYAKRQRSWLRSNMKDWEWVTPNPAH